MYHANFRMGTTSLLDSCYLESPILSQIGPFCFTILPGRVKIIGEGKDKVFLQKCITKLVSWSEHTKGAKENMKYIEKASTGGIIYILLIIHWCNPPLMW